MACRMRVKSNPSGNPEDGTGKHFAQLSPGLVCSIMEEKAMVHFVPPIVILLIFLLHQNTENLSALWSVRFIRPRPLNTQREII